MHVPDNPGLTFTLFLIFRKSNCELINLQNGSEREVRGSLSDTVGPKYDVYPIMTNRVYTFHPLNAGSIFVKGKINKLCKVFIHELHSLGNQSNYSLLGVITIRNPLEIWF